MELDQKFRLIKNLENYLHCKTVKAVIIGKNANMLFKKSLQAWFLQEKYYRDAIAIVSISFYSIKFILFGKNIKKYKTISFSN